MLPRRLTKVFSLLKELERFDPERLEQLYNRVLSLRAEGNLTPEELPDPPSYVEYRNLQASITGRRAALLREFQDLGADRQITLGGMGGAIIGHIPYASIYCFIAMGLSNCDLPVDLYVATIRQIDRLYVQDRQAKIDGDMKQANAKVKRRK